MDEYSILRKKQKKNAFVATALLISIAIALLVMVGAVLVLSKVNDNDRITTSENGTVTEKEDSKESKSESNDSTTCEGLVKEIVFNDNLRNIKEAAISYFTNERLPHTIGESKKITLSSMKEKKLLLNVRDASGNTCSGSDSYVEVTKEENEYVMKIYLSCSDMEDYIIVHLGCYDYCDKDVCEKKEEPKKVFEYEYKKSTSCVMSDWSSWGEWQTTREKTSNLKKEDIKVEKSTKDVVDTKNATSSTTYNCYDYPGYTLVGDKCVKETTITDTKEATPSEYSYNCFDYPGYSIVGDKCVKTETVKDEIDASKNPDTKTCPSGYALNNGRCEMIVTRTETRDGSYVCPGGYSLSGTTCTKVITNTETRDGSYVCPSGYSLSGTTCTKTITNTDIKDGSYVCPSGYSLNGTTCTKTTTTTDTKDSEAVYSTRTIQVSKDCYRNQCTTKTVFSCPTGKACGNYPQTSCTQVKYTCTEDKQEQYISSYKCADGYTLGSDNKCRKTTSSTDTKSATFTCPSGYNISNGKCAKTTSSTDSKSATFTCPSGYNVSSGKCTRTISSTDSRSATFTCPSGFNINNGKCVRNYQETAIVPVTVIPGSYYCAAGYTLSGTKCYKERTVTDTKQAAITIGGYVCPSGYTQNNRTCTKVTVIKDTKDASGNTVYTCPSGYTKVGNLCTKKGTETITKTYYRYATRTCDGGSTDIKWSTSNNDTILKSEGYKLTGNKREIIEK